MRVDWSEAVSRLRARSRLPLAAHARAVGASEQTLTRLARGEVSAPRWDQGCAILDRCADYFTPTDWAAVTRRGAA